MPQRIEITLKEQLLDAEGQSLRLKAKNYFDIDLHRVRTIQVVTIDAGLTADQVERVRAEIFTNPVTQVSSLQPLDVDFDWIIWVGFRPGVRDNPGATAVEAMEDLLRLQFKSGQAVYTSKRYCLKGSGVTRQDAEKLPASCWPTTSSSSGRCSTRSMGSGHRYRPHPSQGDS
jgi:phosphoribosylformylglycinamidine (FGAM) synthase PurS component